MKVVIFKLNSLGDNVVFVPVVQALRKNISDLELTLVTTPKESELYEGALGPQIKIICPKAKFNKAYRKPWELARWIWKIRSIKPDACIVAFDQSNVAHLVAKYSGAKIRIGGNLERIHIKGSLTTNVPIPADLRPLTWNWNMGGALAKALHREADWPNAPLLPNLLHLLPNGPQKAGDRLRIVVHPGTGQLLNQWPMERFASLAASLSRDFEVIWIVHGKLASKGPDGTFVASVDSLSELAQWLASADLFVGNNSGPMHLANALGCAGVAVTGPPTTGWDPFWNSEEWTVLRHPNLACAPCGKTSVALLTCINLANPMECLQYWTSEKVEAACRARLKGILKGKQ